MAGGGARRYLTLWVICLMHSNQPMPDQILARRELCWDRGGPVQCVYNRIAGPISLRSEFYSLGPPGRF